MSDGTGGAKYEMSDAKLVAGLRRPLLAEVVLHGGELGGELPQVPSAPKVRLCGSTSVGECFDVEDKQLVEAAVGL